MPVPELSVDAVRSLLSAGSGDAYLLVDVRQPEEFHGALGHVAGARLVPLGELPGRLPELEPFRGRTIVTLCRAGVRSAWAAELLIAQGFTDVRSMAGGMTAWRQRGHPVER